MKGLAIKDVAERTGIAAGTIRMWEQRYGFPEPERTSAGYRLYGEDDVEALRRVLALRERGLSVPAAVDRVRGADMATDRPSLFGALAGGDQPVGSQILIQADAARDLARDRGRGDVARGVAASCSAPSSASATTARSSTATARWRAPPTPSSCSPTSRASARGGAIAEVPLEAGAALGNEWAVVIDAPGYSACLLAWEQPAVGDARVPDRERTFETLWTLDPRMVRRAAEVGGALARRADDALGARIEAAAGRAPAGDGASGAVADVGDEPDRRLSRRGGLAGDADRADAVRVREAELLRGGLGEIPARLGAERPAVDDGEHAASATRSARRRSSRTGGCGGRRRRARA